MSKTAFDLLSEREQQLLEEYGVGPPPQAGTLFFAEYDAFEIGPHDPDDREDLNEARFRYWTLKRKGVAASAISAAAQQNSAPNVVPMARSRKPVPPHMARARGPKPMVLTRVKNQMRDELRAGQVTVAALRSMLEKVMEGRYRASRDSCRKARNEVLSEFNSQQTSTFDK